MMGPGSVTEAGGALIHDSHTERTGPLVRLEPQHSPAFRHTVLLDGSD